MYIEEGFECELFTGTKRWRTHYKEEIFKKAIVIFKIAMWIQLV